MKGAGYLVPLFLGWLGGVTCFTGLTALRSNSQAVTCSSRVHIPYIMRVSRQSTVEASTTSSAKAKPLNIETKTIVEDPYEVEAQLVNEDKNIYLGLLVLQLVPYLLIQYKYASFVYLGILAVSTVYLGSKRQDIPNERTLITTRQALTAPVLSSVSLFGVFLILKYTDVSLGVAYQALTTLLGIGSALVIVPPVLRSILPESITTIPVSRPLDKAFGGVKQFITEENGAEVQDDQPLLDFAELAVLLTAILAGATYINPDVGLSAKFLVPNALAWCIAMQSIGLISISSFTTAATLLAGLFCYDIFWVFGTEVMMTVATRIEAPVKFLFPSPPELHKSYPFSVLGLGDIVIPATFCTLMRSFDQYLEGVRQAEAAAARALTEKVSQKNPVALWLDSILGMNNESGVEKGGRVAALGLSGVGVPTALEKSDASFTSVDGKTEGERSYFESSVAAYALGLGLCFIVNYVSKAGQPALLYLNPMLIASALGTAVLNGNGQLRQLVSYNMKEAKKDEA